MSLIFRPNQSEEYYRKLLLLDKIKKHVNIQEKSYIFNQKMCWDILLKDDDVSYLACTYADRLQKRIPELEKYILQSTRMIYLYAFGVIEGRWFEAEDHFIKNAKVLDILEYNLYIMRKRWPEVEKYYLKSPRILLSYVINIIEDRFVEGEEVLLNSSCRMQYLNFLRQIGKLNELDI